MTSTMGPLSLVYERVEIFLVETYGYRTFHVVFVPKGADPDAYQFSRISTDSGFPSFPIAEGAPYDFYVKNECTNSYQSEWAGPIAVNY
jgi:hypothetical protein